MWKSWYCYLSQDIRWNIAWALRLYFTVYPSSCHNTDTVYMMSILQVLYMMSYAVTDSVGTQLWLDRTCRVNLNYTGDSWQLAGDSWQLTADSWQLTFGYIVEELSRGGSVTNRTTISIVLIRMNGLISGPTFSFSKEICPLCIFLALSRNVSVCW